MAALLWIYFLSMAIVAISVFTNKEARGVNAGKVTLSVIVSTLFIAIIPVLNTMLTIAYICVKWAEWMMTKRMTKKTETPMSLVSLTIK